eukprot:scaffold249232_cov48-Prasinocladus_malaysianus.AAC.1
MSIPGFLNQTVCIFQQKRKQGARLGENSPKKVAMRLFRILDRRHQGVLDLDQLDRFFGEVFHHIPLQLLYSSFNVETQDRLHMTDEGLSKEVSRESRMYD